MGKMIDSDTVKECLKRVIWGKDPQIDSWVDAMPEADAVPVGWLELQAIACKDENLKLSRAAWTVLQAWGKEKEDESCD